MNNVLGIISLVLQLLQIVEYIVRIVTLLAPGNTEETE